MFEFLMIGLFLWLTFKLLMFSVKVAWGLTKVISVVLFLLALPIMMICLVFAGGVVLFLPLALIGAAYAVLKCSV